MTTCQKCGNDRVEWVGYTLRQLRKMQPSRDVQRCGDCGIAWYYASTGRRITTREYLETLAVEEAR